jgi:3'-phosphoadenosine 5'-phosphosulfate sulfotransferase (PAPS reductase)/FAD synthetase
MRQLSDLLARTQEIIERGREAYPLGVICWSGGKDSMVLLHLQERLDVFPHPQALWIGHKRCDSDPILGGDAGTRVEALVREDGTAVIFPLRDWTHDDVWTYIEEFEVPYDSARYEKHEGVWRERPDRRHNADYVHACTACIDRRPDAPQFVHCPKLQMTIENCSSRLPWVEPRKLSYMEDQAISPS